MTVNLEQWETTCCIGYTGAASLHGKSSHEYADLKIKFEILFKANKVILKEYIIFFINVIAYLTINKIVSIYNWKDLENKNTIHNVILN